MTARDPLPPPADDKSPRDKSPRDKTVRKPDDAPAPAPTTKITPVDRKIGERRGNLRDRADAFNRRRGGK